MANAKIEKYQQNLLNKLLEQMESDANFLKSWTEIPFNPYNGKGFNLYNGINQVNLSMDLAITKSADPRYYTFKQIKDLGLKLQKGAKGVEVQYFNFVDKEIERKGETKTVKIPFVRLTYAFNAQNIDGLKPYEKTKGFAALKDDRNLSDKLNEVINNSGVKLLHGGNRAFYHGGSIDEIMMPPPERFSSKEAYAATLLHELAHSTGHASRQSRDMGDKDFDRVGYAKEELRAELSSVFMCQRLGISYQLENDQTHIENSAAYLKGWKNVLTNDKAEFFKAASDANKITAFLVDGKSFEHTLNKINTKQAISISEHNSNKPVNKDFNNAIDLVWGGGFKKIKQNFISLGDTPEVLQAVGIPRLPLTINYNKLILIREKHQLTPEILKQIPKEISNPVAIFKNKGQDSPKNSYVILTELYDRDNKPVITALHAQRKQKKLEVNRVASIYGKNNKQINKAFNENKLIYYHENKCAGYFDLLSRPPARVRNIVTNKNYKVKLHELNKEKSRTKESQGRSK